MLQFILCSKNCWKRSTVVENMFSVVLSLLGIVTAVLATGAMPVSHTQVEELQFVQSALITTILPRQRERLGYGQGCLGYPYKPSYKTISEGIKRVTEDFKTLEGLLLHFKKALDFEVALKDNNPIILVLMRMSYEKLVKVVLGFQDPSQMTNMALDRPKPPAFVDATALSTKNKIIPVAPPVSLNLPLTHTNSYSPHPLTHSPTSHVHQHDIYIHIQLPNPRTYPIYTYDTNMLHSNFDSYSLSHRHLYPQGSHRPNHFAQ